MMYTLRLLGGVSLCGEDGRELDALLRKPKHLALLAYLCLPQPGAWHRRDSLVGIFWPETDQNKARSLLRSALHVLRGHLPNGVIRNRGDTEVGVDPSMVSTDVTLMERELAAGRYAGALAHYSGALLPGLHLADAEEFDKWLANERARLHALARKSASLLADERERCGDIVGAIAGARRAAELDPDDEIAARRWIALLDRAGDRSQAFAVYDRFREHMAEEFGVRPSAETVALLDTVRTRRNPTSQLQVDSPDANLSSGVAPLATLSATQPANAQTHGQAASILPESPSVQPPRKARWLIASAGVLATTLLVAAAIRRTPNAEGGPGAKSTSVAAARTLVVLPMENETGNRNQDYIAAGLAEGIARRLTGMGGLTIRSGARSEWPAATQHDFKTIGNEFGTKVLLRTRMTQAGDSFEVRTSVVNAQNSGERMIAPLKFKVGGLHNLESELAAAVAGEIFRVPMPVTPRARERAVNPESYRLMLEAWHQMTPLQNFAEAKRLFERATELDPLNSRAWAGLSAVWSLKVSEESVPFDEGYDRGSAAAERALALDSLDGSAWTALGMMRALRYRNLAIGLESIRKAIAAEPGDPQIFVAQSSLYRTAWLWDQSRDAARVAHRLDPLNAYVRSREAYTELCAGNPDAALRLYDAELVMNPTDSLAVAGRIRALAMEGRYDDAIVAWRNLPSKPGDIVLASALREARGDSGYWKANRLVGRRQLDALKRKAGVGWISPLRLMQLQFQSGDTEGGYRALELLEREKDPALFRLRCMPALDVVRRSPRFEAIVKRIGPLPLH